MKSNTLVACVLASSCWVACSSSRPTVTDDPGAAAFETPGAPVAPESTPQTTVHPFLHPTPESVDSAPVPPPPGGPPSFNKTIVNAGAQGELKVAASPDGQNIVVFSAFTTATISNDYGNTFGPATSFAAPSNQGDPQVAVGKSGNFYAEYISWPTGVSPTRTCGNTISWSQDGGKNWAIRSNVVVSPAAGVNVFFPDQEQIAADSFTASPAGPGLDQVYSTWRHFVSVTPQATDACDPNNAVNKPPSPVPQKIVPQIICSKDSAANWINQKAVDSGHNADSPRITVGSDGFVYVTYVVANSINNNNQDIWINKFSNCAAGLNQVAGFPQLVVSNVVPVDCTTGVAGFDRCVGESHGAAVDDTNPSHVYVVYATNTVTGANEDVMVKDSLNGGAAWTRPAVRVNTGTTARRLIPSICTSQGNAFVSWFDQRAAVTGARSDLTDYYGGSVFLGAGASQPLTAGNEIRVSQNSDPTCRSGFPGGVREAGDESQCPENYGNVGQCNTTTTGTPAVPVLCDPRACVTGGTCPCAAGDTCVGQPGAGFPKYGDYVQGACAAGRFYAAWNAATLVPAPPALATMGISLACPPDPGIVNPSLTTDTTPPVIRPGTVPGPVPLNKCGTASITKPTAYDVCGPTVPTVDGFVGGVKIDLSTYSFGCTPTTINWTALDGANNKSLPGPSTVVTVTDSTAPTLTGPSVQNLVDCQPTVHPITIPTPTISDSCGGSVLSGKITAINGVNLSSPIPVSAAGQTTVGPGVLRVEWKATNCSNVASTPLVQTVNLTAAPALYAKSTLNVGALAQVVTTSNVPAPVDNAGTGLVNLTSLGAGTVTGAILSNPSVTLALSTVTAASATSEAIHTGGIVTGLLGSLVTGTVVQLNAPTLPAFPPLNVNYPFNLNEILVLPFTTVTLTPGSYDNVVVNPGGTLKLTAGTYLFNTFNVDPAATVQIDNTLGSVIVDVQTQVLHIGVVSTNGAPNQFVLGYSGILPVFLVTNFQGVVIAPAAAVSLAQPLFGNYAGAFYADSISVAAGVKVTESPYACTIP